jgi:RND family efflux transporter MFP subunit
MSGLDRSAVAQRLRRRRATPLVRLGAATGVLSLHAILLTAAAATLLVACGERNELAKPEPPTVFVQPPIVEQRQLYEEYPGRVEAVDRVEIRARVSGYLQEVLFEAGQDVEPGDVLYRIEREPLQAAVNAAEAAKRITQAQLDLAETELSRAERAFESQAASDLEVRRARAEVERRSGELQAADAQLEQARIDLGYAEIRSPIDGRVSETFVDAGNLVGREGPTMLTVVVTYDPIYAYFDVNEREVLEYLERVPLSERERRVEGVRLRLADGTLYSEFGAVDFANVELDESTGTLRIRATFPNPGRELLPGLFARVGMPLPSDTVMLVPAAATLRDIVGDYVMVVNSDGGVERRDVTLGRLVDDMIVVESGLEESASVIVRGLQRARPGSTVTAQPVEQSPGRADPASGRAPDADADSVDGAPDDSPNDAGGADT